VEWSWDFGDGATSTLQNPSWTYAAGGTYTVTLTVTDNDGGTDSANSSVTVNDTVANNPPDASFTADCTDLVCSFTDTSSDSDGTVVGWSWNFGNGATSTAQNPSVTYGEAGTYTVTLTVTDNDSATGEASENVTVTEPATGGITLSAIGRKERGRQKVDLTWSGTTTGRVDVKRDGAIVKEDLVDTGAYTDPIDARGGGSYDYQVCEAGTDTCSNTVTVTF
jgi:PKD repeat protein